jgi:DNA-binding NarL/FixJ family response regulator
LKVLIADDHGLYRAGLALLLKDRLGIEQVIEVGTLDEALELLANHPGIDLALFDLSMPGMAGLESLAAVKSIYPGTHIAVISGSENRDNVLKAIGTGLSGYIPKSLPDEKIAKALEMMLGGNIFVPPFMIAATPAKPASSAIETAAAPSSPAQAAMGGPARLEALTPRQRDVLNYVVLGRTNKEIARELDIAEGTVKIHLAALFAQFGAHNRTELATRAQGILNGATPPGDISPR